MLPPLLTGRKNRAQLILHRKAGYFAEGFAFALALADRGRLTLRGLMRRGGEERITTLIYGAGSDGLALLREVRQKDAPQSDVIGFVDDDPSKARQVLQGKRVLGCGEELAFLARKYSIQRVLIAIPQATGPQMARILQFAVDAGVEFKMSPGMGQPLRDVALEDLLGRKQVHLDQEGIRSRIQGEVILVTGAAGSIGAEICRQIAHFKPKAVIGFDEAETPLFEIERELKQRFPQLAFYAEIGSITHPEALHRVMRRYQPSCLFHAAAYKHVPMMEKHVFAAVENNIFGTWNVAQAAVSHGVRDFVLISTDKAVRPASMMGATKRVAEMVIRALQPESGVRFVTVRFGNVLGSSGSVVPIFREQIAAGGPVTVTHPEMRRYFMTIPEAAQLVLQAFSMGRGGEVLVLDMGEPVKIVDLARDLILLSGFQPGSDIKIQFTDLRPGEKLFEELNLRNEFLAVTSHQQIRSYSSPVCIDAQQMREHLRDLRQICDDQDVGRLLMHLKNMIPSYNPSSLLLRRALSAPSKHAEPARRRVATEEPEGLLAAEYSPSIR